MLFRRALLTGGGLSVALGVAFSSSDTNSAFVFLKPHANTPAAQRLVAKALAANSITVKSEGELTAAQIDKGMLIDQHYYAIASKATLLKPQDMPVPADKFEAAFGLPWKKALSEGLVFNALDACTALGVDAAGLDALWAKAKKTKFGGGFYCGLVAAEGKRPIYVMNGAVAEPRPVPHPMRRSTTPLPPSPPQASSWRCGPSLWRPAPPSTTTWWTLTPPS
jgi:hypothetical protein